MKIYLDIAPPTTTQKNSVKFNRYTGRTYHTGTFVKERDKIHKLLIEAGAPEKPLDGELELIVKLYFERTKAGRGKVWKNTKPDADNSLAVLADQLEKTGYVINDSRFVIEHVEKYYSENPHIEIEINEVQENDTK